MEKKASKHILLAIMGALIFAELVLEILTVKEDNIFINILDLIPLLFIALYGFWFYKEPHGNLLKYAMLSLAVSQIGIYLYVIKYYSSFYIDTAMIFALCILIYVAGRLNRMEQNKYLLPLSFLVQFVCVLCEVMTYAADFSFAYLCVWFDVPIATLTLMIAYFVRFKEHKEAGLMDAPKK